MTASATTYPISRPSAQAAAARYLCEHLVDAEQKLTQLGDHLAQHIAIGGEHGFACARVRIEAKPASPGFREEDFDQPTPFHDTVLRALRAWVNAALADPANPLPAGAELAVASVTTTDMVVTVQVPLF